MAVSKFTGKRRRARNSSSDRRKRQPTSRDLFRDYVRSVSHTLRLTMCVASTAAEALKRQGAEMDEDIALVLHRCCCEPLFDELQRAESLLYKLSDVKEVGPSSETCKLAA